MNDTIKAVRQSLTLTEIGVIVSLLSTAVVGIFTVGFVYGQVQSNTDRINVIQPKVEKVSSDIGSIQSNVKFLTDLAKEERDRHR